MIRERFMNFLFRSIAKTAEQKLCSALTRGGFIIEWKEKQTNTLLYKGEIGMKELTYEKHQARYIGQDMMEYCAAAKFEDLPAEVVTRAKHIVMDDIACTLAGAKTRHMFENGLEYLAERTPGVIAPLGCTVKTRASMAAFLNAFHAQTHDFNDGLNNSGMLGGAYHPSRTVVSVALAVGEELHSSGKDILLAVVLGVEAAARMRNPSQKNFVADTYSAAVTAAKLMGADAKQMRAACALAAYTGPETVGKKLEYTAKDAGHKAAGPTCNPLAYAYIARSGIEAAEMAMLGFEGPVIDDNNAIASRYYTCGLGKDFQCMDMYFKPWPCCRKTHGAIDAALSLRNEHGIKAEDIKKIDIYQQTTGMYVNTPIAADMDINFGGQFSLQYTVTCVFLDGNVELKHYRWPDRKAPQRYVDFAKKITVHPDNGLDGYNAISPNHGIVEVELNDGRVFSMYCKYPLGSEPNALTEAQRIEKLRLCAEDLTEAQKDELINRILTLDQLEAM